MSANIKFEKDLYSWVLIPAIGVNFNSFCTIVAICFLCFNIVIEFNRH